MKLIRFLAGALLSVIAGSSFALVPADIPGVPKDLRVGPPKAVLDRNLGRKQALAVTTPVLTPNQLFDWAEITWPTLFPKGPQSIQLTYNGVAYTARSYGTGNAIGVTAAGVVQGIGPFTGAGDQLVTYGTLADYTCQVLPAVCGGGTTGPGVYRVDPSVHTLAPNYNNEGKATYLGTADGKSRDTALSEIGSVCFYSNRTGWGADARACTPPQADGSLRVIGVCNRDRGLPAVVHKDGTVLWPGLSPAVPNGYQVLGDAGPKIVFGMIEYGDYQAATISTVVEANGTVTLVMDFAANCAFGFGRDNKLVSLDPALPLMFMWHGAKAGAGHQPGWGLGTLAPSIRQAYFDEAEAKKGHLVVKFPNMACNDQGGITVYRAKSVSEDGKTVVYDSGSDGFGAGWMVGDSIWSIGQGAKWDQKSFSLTWDVPLCVEK